MGTRSVIAIKARESDTQGIYFYHHWDGYPSYMLPLLKQFMDKLWAGHFRANPSQAAGWIIVLGIMETSEYAPLGDTKEPVSHGMRLVQEHWNKSGEEDLTGSNWKVGGFEPLGRIELGSDGLPDMGEEYYYEIIMPERQNAFMDGNGSGCTVRAYEVLYKKGKRLMGTLTQENWEEKSAEIIAASNS